MDATEILRRSFPLSGTGRADATDEVIELTLHAIEQAGGLGVRCSSSPDQIAESAAETVALLAGERTAASHNVARTLMGLQSSAGRKPQQTLTLLLWWALSHDRKSTIDESKVAELIGWSPDSLRLSDSWQSARQPTGGGQVTTRSAMQFIPGFAERQAVLDDHGISPVPSCT